MNAKPKDERQHAPEPSIQELAIEAAPAAPDDFAGQDYPPWSWPWRLARRLQRVPGVTVETDSYTFRSAVLAFCERAAVVQVDLDLCF